MQSVRCHARPNAARPKRRKRAAVPLLALVALIVAAVAAPFAEAVPSEAPQATWITDKAVKATAKSGDTLYIGGEFERLGKRTGPAAAFDATTGELTKPSLISGSPSEVEVVEADGEGGYYAGGRFSHADGEAHMGIVHIKADGSVDPDFAVSVDETVEAIARDGSTVYIGGKIQEVNGEVRKGIAAVSAETGELLSWAPEIYDNAFNTDYVYALAVVGEHVYVGGKFGLIDGESRENLATFNTVGSGAGEGELTEWQPEPNSQGVRSLAVSGSLLYAGGQFNEVGGEPRKYVAAFDLSTGEPGEPELTGWTPAEPNGKVLAVAVSEDGEAVYIGGDFSQVNAESHSHVAALKAEDGTVLAGWSGEANSTVYDLAVSGSTVYAGGNFGQADGEKRNGAAALDAGSGALQSWSPDVFGSTVHSVAVSGSDVVIGGFFNGADGIARENIAAIDLTTGQPLDWAPEANNKVYALAMSEDESRVFVGGYYTEIGGEPRERLASLKAAGTGTGEGEPTAWDPGANNSVEAIAVDGSRVYVGGGFSTLEGDGTFGQLAAFDFTGDVGTLDEAWKPEPNNNVTTLVANGEKVYVGGQFSEIGEQERHNLALLNDTDGAASESWAPEPSATVKALAVSGATVFAGGQFTSVGGESHQRVVKIEPNGEPSETWNAEVQSQEVLGIATDGSAVYVGGMFSRANGDYQRQKLVAFDAASGELLSWYPGSQSTVHSLEYRDSQLIVGGQFSSVERGPQQGIAVFSAPVLTVAESGTGTGTVTSSPAGIECGSTCSSGFGAGQEVTLTATPDAGSEFAGWSGGGCSGTGPCVATLNADVNVTAQFAAASSPEGEGTEGPSGEGGPGSSGTGATGSASEGGPTAGSGEPFWINTRIKLAKIHRPAPHMAGFWFHAKGNTRVKRFECSLVKKPTTKDRALRRKQIKRRTQFKRCGPRKRVYQHLKPGRYVFRVRAVGAHAEEHRKAAKRRFRIR